MRGRGSSSCEDEATIIRKGEETSAVAQVGKWGERRGKRWATNERERKYVLRQKLLCTQGANVCSRGRCLSEKRKRI